MDSHLTIKTNIQKQIGVFGLVLFAMTTNSKLLLKRFINMQMKRKTEFLFPIGIGRTQVNRKDTKLDLSWVRYLVRFF